MSCVLCRWLKFECPPGYVRAVAGETEEYRAFWDEDPLAEVVRDANARHETDPKAAQATLTEAANAGSPMAMALLGIWLMHGSAGRLDLRQAEHWMQRAIAAGNGLAYRYLAVLYRFRHDQAAEKAVLEAGAAVGDRRSIYMLGMLYLNGPRQYRDLDLAAQTLYRSVLSGSAYAKRRLGWLYLSGRGGVWNVGYGLRMWLGGLRDAYRVAMRFWDQENHRTKPAAVEGAAKGDAEGATPVRLKRAA